MELYKLHFIVPILLSLLFLILVQMESNFLPERCIYLKNDTELLKLKCKGKYPLWASTKYQDTLIDSGEPMGIYMVASLHHVVVVLKSSPLLDCPTLEFIDVNVLNCIDENGGNNTITLSSASIFCFPFHIQLPDDLLKDCLEQNEMEMDIVSDVLKTKVGVVHYTFDENRAADGQTASMGLIFLLWIIIFSHKFICF
ncbi:uncharacterized protein LOC111519493 [Drosophila willistoni]|uniref:uncharacterized protein LOC111519493 n=1 Tax=Drosophila willistoni TaxID=7260 RepID=UPI001F0732E9|nr:uncharacterized protein LOC111519493 [Drosophila willistoni]